MTEVTLYVESSMCSATGAAGWGATLSHPATTIPGGGPLEGEFHGVTHAELCAVREAMSLIRRHAKSSDVVIAMRSAGALAILRWVFPEAKVRGPHIEPPRKLKAAMKNAECLYDLHDEVERLGLRVVLMHVAENEDTRLALDRARDEMERSRGYQKRSAAR